MPNELENIPVEDIGSEVRELLAAGDTEGAKRALAPLHPTETARLIESVGADEAVAVYRLLDADIASETLLHLEGHLRELIVSELSHDELIGVVTEMATDDAADVVSELTDEGARKVLDGIAWKESIVVQKLLKYPEDTAGGKMQAELVKVAKDATIRETIEAVRKRADGVENIACVFVVDEDGRLEGTVTLDKLILAREDARVMEVTDTGAIRVKTGVDQEEVARLFQRFDLLSLAVVDEEERLVGRITIDDMVDVIEEEIFEDFYRMASLNIGERVLDPPFRSFGMRAPWLMVNLVTAFLAASVVKIFEGTIESFVILAVLMPVVAGLGGNAATQTITVVVRGLALGDFDLKGAKKVLIKEGIVGLSNGVVVGAVAAIGAYLLGANYMVGILLFLAMTANLVIAGLSGAIIPLILKWWKADPALSASVFVTACTDICGFFTLLGLAAFFMSIGLM